MVPSTALRLSPAPAALPERSSDGVVCVGQGMAMRCKGDRKTPQWRHSLHCSPGASSGWSWDKWPHRAHPLHAQGFGTELIIDDTKTLEWPAHEPDRKSITSQEPAAELQWMIARVRELLQSLRGGEISASPYDTAWVSLLRRPGAASAAVPMFPSCIDWIVRNQLADGSWGDAGVFSVHDRLINTLACVIALVSWQLHPDMSHRGMLFIQKNVWKLAEAAAEPMPIGFEITFPSLVDFARSRLGLDVPFGEHVSGDICAKRRLKIEKIPREVLHRVPTSLLHSLEGLPDLDWEQLMELQCRNGSFLFSPAATVYAFMQTGDERCLGYLDRIVTAFSGAVPNVYPVDLFERLWIADRLERLGISRHFRPEIKDCLDYVHRNWSERGICWARDSVLPDVDDTAMAFRLLRQHGYNVSPTVLEHFERDGEFFCFERQSSQAVTGMYNLNRASQVAFPGEHVLKRARRFSDKFLRGKLARNALQDKWFITKDLRGEVRYALHFPWFASLPRVEARVYLEQYGGTDDVWIGKTLYRMPLVSNDLYLELARADFDACQRVHQLEWHHFEMCYNDLALGLAPRTALRAYFLAAASIFEPSRAPERLGWAKTAVVAEAASNLLRRAGKAAAQEGLAAGLRRLIDELAGSRREARQRLQEAWREWFESWTPEREETAALLVRTIEVCAGRFAGSGEGGPAVTATVYAELAQLVSSICHRLRGRSNQVCCSESYGAVASQELEADIQHLTQCVLSSSDAEQSGDGGYDESNRRMKHTFLAVAKSYLYLAHCPVTLLDSHISMVLFEPASTPTRQSQCSCETLEMYQ